MSNFIFHWNWLTIMALRTNTFHRYPNEVFFKTFFPGLIAVLELLGRVCMRSEAVRLAIAENTQWQPILVCIGILGCGVPSQLKAELLSTLSALAGISTTCYVHVDTCSIISMSIQPRVLPGFRYS